MTKTEKLMLKLLDWVFWLLDTNLICKFKGHLNPEPDNPWGIWHWHCKRCGATHHHSVNTPGHRATKLTKEGWL